MKNREIREYAKAHRTPLWEIADFIGVSEPTMTRKLRHELPEGEKQRVMEAIKQIAAEREEERHAE